MMQEFFLQAEPGCAGGFAVPGMTGGWKEPPSGSPRPSARGEKILSG